MHEDLIDRVYEAAFMPEHWPAILDELSKLTSSQGGLLLSTREKSLSWTASESIHGAFADYLSEGWFRRCGRRVCLIEQARNEFLREHDYWTEEELAENEIYKQFFRPRDLGVSAGTGLISPAGDAVVFSVERSHTQGPIEADHIALLNELRPHLARSAAVAARMGLKTATTTQQAFDELGLPTLLLNRDGAVVEKSTELTQVKDDITIGANDRLILNDPDANTLLHDALAIGDRLTGVKSFPLRAKDGCPVGVAHLIPITRSAHDVFAQGYAVLVINPMDAKANPSASLLRSLFDLTASEAKVARALAKGLSVDDIAAEGDVSVNTVRSQVRKIMEKTGCTRQPEVVALVSNVALERGINS